MEPAMHQSSFSAVWADALFVSALQRYDQPSAGQVQQAVAAAMGVFGPRGCAERVAQEFGDHPETAVADALGRTPGRGGDRGREPDVTRSWSPVTGVLAGR